MVLGVLNMHIGEKVKNILSIKKVALEKWIEQDYAILKVTLLLLI